MSSYDSVCGTSTSEAARREDLPSGPAEDEGTVPGDLVLCSTLPGKANDIMPVLFLPHPREAKGDRPDACRGTGGPWHRQWKTNQRVSKHKLLKLATLQEEATGQSRKQCQLSLLPT